MIEDLTTYPSAPPPINWQNFAQEHGVPGRNRGQVVKELAKQSGIDISRLEGSTPNIAHVQLNVAYHVVKSQLQQIHHHMSSRMSG